MGSTLTKLTFQESIEVYVFESPHTYNGADEEVIELRMPQARGVVLEVCEASRHIY